MAIVAAVNNDYRGGTECLWRLKSVLKAAGWTVPFSGSGSDIDCGAGLILPGSYFGGDLPAWGVGNTRFWGCPGLGALGIGTAAGTSLGRPRSWFCIVDPNGRGWFFGRSKYENSDNGWCVAYSPDGWVSHGDAAWDDGTLYGHPVSPTGREQVIVGWNLGWEVDQFLLNTNAGFPVNSKFHCWADSAPSASGEYSLIMLNVYGTNQTQEFLAQDPFEDSYDPLNPHPLAVVRSRSLHGGLNKWFGQTYMHYGLESELWKVLWGSEWRDTGGFLTPGGGGTGADGKERPLPVPYLCELPNEHPGMSSMFWWNPNGSAVHAYPDQADGEDYLYVQDVMLYGWPNAVVPQSYP